MPRTKEFDPAVALDAAMRLFWERGYESTSTADLVTTTGVARASLYATFGSKRELYLAALERYVGGGGGLSPEEVAAAAQTPLGEVRAILLEAVRLATTDEYFGCLAVNATVEQIGADPDVGQVLERERLRKESVLYAALLRAQRDGTVRGDLDPADTARLLLAVITGVLALSRGGSDQRRRIDGAVAAAMRLIGN